MKLTSQGQGSGEWRNKVEIFEDMEDKKGYEITVSSEGGKEAGAEQKKKELGRSSKEVFDSCSLSDKRLMILIKDREGRNKKERRTEVVMRGGVSPMRMVRRKLAEGLSAFKATAGDQPNREP